MREKIALLMTGAACALGGMVVSGGMAGAQSARSSSDAQIVRAIQKDTRDTTQAIRDLRGRFGTSAPTLQDIVQDLGRITTATRSHCSLYHQVNDRTSGPCG